MKLRFLSVYLLMLFAAQAAFSQGPSLFNAGGNSKRDKALPTVITADTMDIQTAKNIAIFTGNVVVKDQELTINCLKMTIYLEDKAKTGTASAEAVPGAHPAEKATPEKTTPATSDKTVKSKDSKGGKNISKIICEGDVVIVRKTKDDNGKEKEQHATAGKAEYDLKEQKITLSDNPVMMQGTDKVDDAETIVLFRDSERVLIQGGKGKTPALKISTETLDMNPQTGEE